MWNRAWNKAPASTTRHGEGSQLFCVFWNLLVTFTTITEKQQILDTKSAFWYLPVGFEVTRLSIEQMFEEFYHAAATTAGFKGCYCHVHDGCPKD